MLYIVPTPIGNLEDITLRAINTLKEVDKVLAEDTRVTGKLLKHLDISKPLESFHAHNEHKRVDALVEELANGQDMALVSDAGTPGISDPGFLLIRQAVQQGVQVTCLPGPTAFVPALVMSGLPCDKFHFEGFLPHKKGKQTRVKYLLSLDQTSVFYESPHRLIKTLELIQDLGGASRMVSVSREISKMFEENVRGLVPEVLEVLKSRSQIKGEIVVCLSANDQ